MTRIICIPHSNFQSASTRTAQIYIYIDIMYGVWAPLFLIGSESFHMCLHGMLTVQFIVEEAECLQYSCMLKRRSTRTNWGRGEKVRSLSDGRCTFGRPHRLCFSCSQSVYFCSAFVR